MNAANLKRKFAELVSALSQSINMRLVLPVFFNSSGDPVEVSAVDPLPVVVAGITVEGFSYGTAPVQKAPVAASVTSVTLLAANANRKLGSVFTNSSASATLYLSLSATATDAAPRVLPPGSTYIMDDSSYLGIVTGIWSAATGQCNVEEAV